MYCVYIICVSVIGVEVIGGYLFVMDGKSLYLKKERFFVRDDELGYVLKSNFQKDGVDNKLYPNITIEVNSDGKRMPEYDTRPKIVLVGDSVAFGFGLNYKDTITNQLENMLNNEYQVVNAGVPGYNTLQWQTMAVKLAEKLKPKVIIALINANDFETRYYPIRGGGTVTGTKSYPWQTTIINENEIPEENYGKSILLWLANQSDLTKIKLSGLNPKKETDLNCVDRGELEKLEKSELRNLNYFNSNTLVMRQKISDEVSSLNKFSQKLKGEGINVIFAFLPFRISGTKPIIGLDKRYEYIAKSIEATPTVKVVELKKILNKHEFFLPCDAHTSKSGNEVIANALYEKLVASEMLKK